MTSTTDPRSGCCQGHDGHGSGDLPHNPFVALRAIYGMSLGEDDFRTLMGHPRGKLMLHQAWLHGRGVVWGLAPEVRERTSRTGETIQDLWVSPGVAIDGLGRELHVSADQCVPLLDWLSGSRDDDATVGPRVACGVLVGHFVECPSRLVPALADPCDVTRRRNDYSRVAEGVRFTIEDDWPATGTTYRRVRVFLGLAAPMDGDDDILRARVDVSHASRGKRAEKMLRHLERFSMLDALDLQPAVDPVSGDVHHAPTLDQWSGVMLGRVRATVDGTAGCWRVSKVSVAATPRRTLLPTDLLQDLVCAQAPGLLGGGSGKGERDAGGPRLCSEIAWTTSRTEFTFQVSSPLAAGSQERGVEVSSLDDGDRGWSREEVERISLSEGATRVTVVMNAPVDFRTVRIIIRGTGRFPLVGVNAVPFAGHQHGPPGTLDDGHDAVITQWSDARREAQELHQQRSMP